MPATVRDVASCIEKLAPVSLAEVWDKVGLQIGDPAAPVHRVVVALDVDDRVVTLALERGAEMIVAHHPLIFRPLTQIRYDQSAGHLLQRLVQNNLAVYAAHTNLDNAAGGVSAVLAGRLGLSERQVLKPLASDTGLGQLGWLPADLRLVDFANLVKDSLGLDTVRVSGDLSRPVRCVAVCGGSGADLIQKAAEAGADVLVTGDLRYHETQDGLALGLALVDAGHAGTEQPVVPFLAQYLRDQMSGEYADLSIEAVPHAPTFRTV